MRSRSHKIHPATTVVIPSPVITFGTLRFFTAACRIGPAEGPTSAADGPMNPTNRNADPTHKTLATMCRRRNTIMNRFAASVRFPSSTGVRSAEP